MTEDETVMWIREHIDEIEDVSRRCVAEENYDYPVTAAVTTCWFPDKTYGDVTFPAGIMRRCVLRSVRQKDITGGAFSIRVSVFAMRQMQSFRMKEKKIETCFDRRGVFRNHGRNRV